MPHCRWHQKYAHRPQKWSASVPAGIGISCTESLAASIPIFNISGIHQHNIRLSAPDICFQDSSSTPLNRPDDHKVRPVANNRNPAVRQILIVIKNYITAYARVRSFRQRSFTAPRIARLSSILVPRPGWLSTLSCNSLISPGPPAVIIVAFRSEQDDLCTPS